MLKVTNIPVELMFEVISEIITGNWNLYWWKLQTEA
jgi:hypothetical protein